MSNNYANIPNLPTYTQFRATETWQTLVDHFRSGMPLKSHRHQIWFKDNCFTGFEAVDWMYNAATSGKLHYLFNKGVTRQQIVALMNKFYEAGIFQAVSTAITKFKDKSELYEFALPKNINKPLNRGSVLSSLNGFLMNKPRSLSPQPQKSDKINSHRMKSYSMENVAMNTYLNENHKIANFIIQNLRNILKSFNMDDFLNIENLNNEWIIMNIYNRDFNADGLFPHWVKSAMDSLTSDMEINESTYPGFNADVYSVIKDYFLNSEEPLIPISFYEIFISILVVVERHDHMCSKKVHLKKNNCLNYNQTQLPSNMCWETNLSSDHAKTCVVNKCFDISGQLSRSSTSSCSSVSFFESCEVEQSKMEHKPLKISHKYSKPKLIRTTSSPEISVKTISYYQRNMEKIKKRKMGRTISNNVINPTNLNHLNDSFYSDEYGFKDNKTLDNDKFVCPSTTGYVNFGLFQSDQINNDDINGFDLDMAISSLHKLVDITQIDQLEAFKYQSFNGLNEKSVHLGIILYQLLCLCLPPLQRAKLQVFLKFVSHLSSTYSKITDKLCCAVLRQNINQFEYDCLATDVVKFLLHNQKLLFLPIKTDSILSEKFNFFKNNDDHFYKSNNNMHYCLRISDKEFEKQRSTESKEALNELLDQIINSTTMSSKEKSKRTKLFQKLYPDVYRKRTTYLEEHKNYSQNENF